MIHYSCDRCNKTINACDEIRYVVRIEVQLAIGETGNQPLDSASLEELEEMLGQIDDRVVANPDDATSNDKTFDLCSKCYGEYIDNPLAIEAVGIGFSKN